MSDIHATSDFDLGPLTWVKGEIDLALERAGTALGDYRQSGDPTQLKFARTHLHQAHGALAMVGLEGVPQVSEALESLLLAIEAGQIPLVPDAAGETLAALHRYLDDMLAGAPHQPLRLLPNYLAIAIARGDAKAHPADLFYPDLGRRPPRRAEQVALTEDARRILLKSERLHYQKALLSWLKKPAEADSARSALATAVAAVESQMAAPAERTFWWIALAFIDALAQPAVAADPRARQLCSHIDTHWRRQLEGASALPERLLRDALYFIAQAPRDSSPRVAEIQAHYGLPGLLPDITASRQAVPEEGALRRLHDALGRSEDLWGKACAAPAAGALANFAEQVKEVEELTDTLGHTEFKRLGRSISAVAGWLAGDPGHYGEAVAMEVATAILVLQNAQENFRALDGDFAQQVDLMVARLHACLAGQRVSDGGLPTLDAMTRRAQEKLLVGQVAREIRNNLAQAEQALDLFFRQPDDRTPLASVSAPLKQIAGALAMLGHFPAVSHLKTCQEHIERFSNDDAQPSQADFEEVATRLSILGFFVEALPQGESDFERFAARLQGLPEPERAAPGEEALAPAEAVTAEASAATSDDPLTLPETEELQEAAPLPASMPQPSAETRQLAEASHEAIDAELLAIFLEEAQSVLATLAEHLAILQASPGNESALTTLRRATHTLKGSGRMVGLNQLGETAWELEQTLNLWLAQELPVTTELLAMLADEQTLFGDWIRHLETGAGAPPDPTALLARARRLRSPEATPAESGEEDIKLSAAAAALADLLSPHEQAQEQAHEPAADADALPAPPTESAPSAAAPVPDSSPADSSEPLTEAAASPTVKISPALYDIFRAEAAEHLASLQQHARTLGDKPALPVAFAMTRAAHTLGGIAGTVGLLAITRLAHALEEALLRRDAAADPHNADDLASVGAAIGELQAMYDGLARQQLPREAEALLARLAASYPPVTAAPPAAVAAPTISDVAEPPAAGEVTSLPQLQDEIDEQLLPLFLAEAGEQLPEIARLLRQWRAHPDDNAAARAIARLLHTFKGNARMSGALNLGEFTHLLESRVADALHGRIPVDDALFDEFDSGCDTLLLGTEALKKPAAPAATPSAPAIAPSEAGGESTGATLRVPAVTVDRLVNEAGELAIARSRIEGEMRSLKTSLHDLTDNVIRLRRQLRDIEIEAEGQMQAGFAQPEPGNAAFDPLELDRFTRFQELTRFMAESVNDVATVQQQLLKNLDDANAALLAQSRLNRSLQQELMGIRMLPFASQSERLYRIARQTAKEAGKRVHLDIVGGQVEMDRSVLDRMLGPLEHMLRNAISHGIEDAAVRQAAGKPEQGEITLALAQEGNEISLTISDDGRGLDPARIRTRAIELGLQDSAADADERQLFQLIFRPGFSTADTVTQIAGRGVGMDVVRTEVSALGGRIDVQSSAGRGCSFKLSLPLTLAVTQTLLLRAGGALYALPSTLIAQVQDVRDGKLAEIRAAGGVEWQGETYPFHYLPRLLGQPDAALPAQRQYPVLLLRAGSQHMALLVDELAGNQEVVVKNIGPQLARVQGIGGATVLGDGQIVLILNPLAVAVAATGSGPDLPAAPPPARVPTVLVVDDSLTVRKFTSRLLERAGYRVHLAKDGVDAIEQLAGELPDVVLSDIEMPRMDGFELVRTLRSDEQTRALPIVMITSRTADKHRNHALELGANHYLGKPYDEEQLLAIVASHCTAPPA